MACHIELNDGVSNLASKAFTPTHVHDDPKIYTCRAVHRGKYKIKGPPSKDLVELKVDLLIIDLWTQGTYSINDTIVVRTDATTYKYRSPKNVLETAEKAKKKKYPCA